MEDLWRRLVLAEGTAVSSLTPDKILRRLETDTFAEPLFNGESYRSAQLIALAALFLKYDKALPERLLTAVTSAIAVELHPSTLAEWRDPKNRKAELAKLCERLGIEKPRPQRASRVGLVEFRSHAELLKKMKEWSADNDQWGDEYPRFCKTLDALIESQLGFDFDDAYFDGTRQRLMTMAYYVARKLDLPKDATFDLVKRAQAFVWPGIAE